jgi:hypothetical protein
LPRCTDPEEIAAIPSATSTGWSRPFADPGAAARKPITIANTIEPVQEGRVFDASKSMMQSDRPIVLAGRKR